jgi:hypothetical protein
MDKETITRVFDKFVDDKFTDAEEELKDAFIHDRDEHLSKELGLDYKDADTIEEKWAKDVKIEKTGEHAGKTVEQLKSQIEALKGKPGNKEKMSELVFALRAKGGWKKGEGATD